MEGVLRKLLLTMVYDDFSVSQVLLATDPDLPVLLEKSQTSCWWSESQPPRRRRVKAGDDSKKSISVLTSFLLRLGVTSIAKW